MNENIITFYTENQLTSSNKYLFCDRMNTRCVIECPNCVVEKI